MARDAKIVITIKGEDAIEFCAKEIQALAARLAKVPKATK